jgi:2-methylcitrate dehydratase
VDKTLDSLATFAHDFDLDGLPSKALAGARQRVVDSIGCAVAGHDSPPAEAARRLALEVADPRGSRVWGSLLRTTPEDAAFANGVALRYLDFNDTYRKLDGSHPSDNLPALMAVAEHASASGRDLIAGLVISYEVQSRFADVVPFNALGWDQPTAGVIAAALGAGKILKLSADQLRNAVSIAIVANMALHQTRRGELSWWKGCAAAMGARQGSHAARMAAYGMKGPAEPFEGADGVWARLGQRYDVTDLGLSTWAIQQSNLKTWPVRDSCQLPIDTALMLRERIAREKIAKLTIQTYESAYKGAIADEELWRPKTRETADHSMLVAVSLALLDGSVTPASFSAERFKDEDVLALIGSVTVERLPEFNSAAPARRNCRLVAELTSGRTVDAHLVLTQEDIERGKSDDDVTAKFLSLTGSLPRDRRDQLLERLWHIDEQPLVSDVVDLLGTGSPNR